jgi:polyhydroxyalkanoate synthesis regulator phasin
MSKETTFSSTEGLELGFVDQIKKTGKKIEQMADHYELMVACSDIYNNNNDNFKPNVKKMKKLANLLGLNPEASEESIVNVVSDLQNNVSDIQALTDERDVLKSKVDALSNEINVLKESAMTKDAENLINDAVAKGIINEKSTEKWIDSAKRDFEGTKELLNGLIVIPANINDGLQDNPASDQELINKFEELLDSPEKMDAMPEAEFKAMEEAYEKIMKLKKEDKNFSVVE